MNNMGLKIHSKSINYDGWNDGKQWGWNGHFHVDGYAIRICTGVIVNSLAGKTN